jgi:hypothetical protein
MSIIKKFIKNKFFYELKQFFYVKENIFDLIKLNGKYTRYFKYYKKDFVFSSFFYDTLFFNSDLVIDKSKIIFEYKTARLVFITIKNSNLIDSLTRRCITGE